MIAVQQRSVNKIYYAIHWIAIYPVDRVILLSNNLGLMCSSPKILAERETTAAVAIAFVRITQITPGLPV